MASVPPPRKPFTLACKDRASIQDGTPWKQRGAAFLPASSHTLTCRTSCACLRARVVAASPLPRMKCKVYSGGAPSPPSDPHRDGDTPMRTIRDRFLTLALSLALAPVALADDAKKTGEMKDEGPITVHGVISDFTVLGETDVDETTGVVSTLLLAAGPPAEYCARARACPTCYYAAGCALVLE